MNQDMVYCGFTCDLNVTPAGISDVFVAFASTVRLEWSRARRLALRLGLPLEDAEQAANLRVHIKHGPDALAACADMVEARPCEDEVVTTRWDECVWEICGLDEPAPGVAR
jgi:hypothetical protein